MTLCNGLYAKKSSPKTGKTSKGIDIQIKIDYSPAEVNSRITKGLDYLESQQKPDGFWQNDARTMRMETTAWALLAFLSNGHSSRTGPYRNTVEKGLNWLAGLAKTLKIKKTYLKTPHESINVKYGPVIFTLLTAVGMGTKKVASEDLVILCEKLIENLRKIQYSKKEDSGARKLDEMFVAGGWGRVEESYWFSLCMIAARQIGIKVPDIVLTDILEFWLRHYQPQHGNFYDQLNRGNVGMSYGPVYPGRIMTLLALLGKGQGPEAQSAIKVLKECPITDRTWFWMFGGQPKSRPSPWADHSRGKRSNMRGHSRFHGELFLAIQTCSRDKELIQKVKREYTGAILANQLEKGSFRFPGWEFTWGKSEPYGSEKMTKQMGYGRGWTEVMITGRALYALGLQKNFIPAFQYRMQR